MTNPKNDRIIQIKGTLESAAFELGKFIKQRIERNIRAYIEDGHVKLGLVDLKRTRNGALAWFYTLPSHFQKMLEAFSCGAEIPLQRVVEWSYSNNCFLTGCSGFIYQEGGEVWIGRNNDAWLPHLWGYTLIRNLTDRLPNVTFGLEGDLFTSTGVNAAGLWLHYNSFPILPMEESTSIEGLNCFVWLQEALETCKTLIDVKALLSETPRRESMILFAANCESLDYTILECSTKSFIELDTRDAMVATNHSQTGMVQAKNTDWYQASVKRNNRIQELLHKSSVVGFPSDGMKILGDKQVERHGEMDGAFWTVFSNLICLKRRQIWHAYGGPPSASQGDWSELLWPWN